MSVGLHPLRREFLSRVMLALIGSICAKPSIHVLLQRFASVVSNPECARVQPVIRASEVSAKDVLLEK